MAGKRKPPTGLGEKNKGPKGGRSLYDCVLSSHYGNHARRVYERYEGQATLYIYIYIQICVCILYLFVYIILHIHTVLYMIYDRVSSRDYKSIRD